MKITNKRSLYSIETENNQVVGLRGEMEINESGKVIRFSGQVTPAVVSDADPGAAYGSFIFQLVGGREHTNVESSQYRKEAIVLLDAVVDEIESKFND